VKYQVAQKAQMFRIQLLDTVYNTPVHLAVGEIVGEQFTLEAVTNVEGILQYESTVEKPLV
jgi:hypothetical protein